MATEAIEALAASIPPAPGPEFPEKNIAYRKKICEYINASEDFAAAANLKASRDVVWWFNTFVWTQNPKDFPENPHRPVILFPKQAKFVLRLDEKVEIDREPLLLEKSREQLASVASANYCLWRFIYRENAAMLIGSFKGHEVDGPSYAKAIFPKIDYTIKYMPTAMLPAGWNRKKPGPCRKHMAIINPVTEKVIEGDTCNENFGRGGRFAFVWVDEFAAIKLQDHILTAIGNATKCFLLTTTPKGIEMFAQMAQSGDFEVFRLHWTDNYLWHPQGYKPEECDWENGVWPEEWVCKSGCRVHPMGGWPHSEKYDHECKQYGYDPIKIAQELDVNYRKSGGAVFDQDKVREAIKHCAALVRDKHVVFEHVKLEFQQTSQVILGGGKTDIEKELYKHARKWPVKATKVTGGPLRIWKHPFVCRDRDCLCKGSGLHQYAFGGDPSRNLDGDSDVGYMMDITAGEVVAEWEGRTDPKELGIEWAKLCKYYGSSSMQGARDAWATVEFNDCGLVVNDVMDRMGVPLHRSRNERDIRKGYEGHCGVYVSKYNKPVIMLECLLPEINQPDPENDRLPRLVCPFVGFWIQCETFVFLYSAKTDQRPEFAKMGAQTRKQHDDRVSAMGLCVYGALDRFGKIRGYIRRDTPAKATMHQLQRVH